MSELEDRINSVLNDPEELKKLSSLAKTLMEGGGLTGEPAVEKGGGDDAALLKKLLGSFGAAGRSSGSTAMLHAISPYLSERRGRKLERAMRYAAMARAAKLVLSQYGGDGDGAKQV